MSQTMIAQTFQEPRNVKFKDGRVYVRLVSLKGGIPIGFDIVEGNLAKAQMLANQKPTLKVQEIEREKYIRKAI